MSSPSRSPSPDSDNESNARLDELKVQVEAATRAAEAKRARKEQERKERKERKEREKREREEREEQEKTLHRIREVVRAVAEVAREMAESEQVQTDREQEALRRMRTGDVPTEAEMGAPEGPGEDGSGDDRGPGSGASEAESEGESVPVKLRSPRREVVTSRQNTAEVVIVRPPKRGNGTSEQTGGDQVSPDSFGRGSELTKDLGTLLSVPVREVLVSGRALCPLPRAQVDLHQVPRTQGPVQSYPRPG